MFLDFIIEFEFNINEDKKKIFLLINSNLIKKEKLKNSK